MDSQSTSLTDNSSCSHPRATYLDTTMLPHHHTLINLIWTTGKTVDSSFLGGGPLTQTIITISNLNPSQLTVKDSPLSPWTRFSDYLTTKSRCTGGPHILKLHFWNQWLPLIKMSYSLSYLENFHFSNFQHPASEAAYKFEKWKFSE